MMRPSRTAMSFAFCVVLAACQPSSTDKPKVITDLVPEKPGQSDTEAVSNVKDTKMDIGNCFITPVEIGDGGFDPKPTDCAQPHTFEVYSRLMLSEKEYPGRQVLIDTANQHCDSALDAHIKSDVLSEDSTYQPIFPSQGSWYGDNDRDIFCLYMEYESGSEDRRKLMTGSVLIPPTN